MPGTGGDRYRLMNHNRLFWNADAIIFMYSIEERFTLESVRDWYENTVSEVRPNFDNCILALVGTKYDLLMEIEVHTIEEMCKEIGAKLHFFTSAKTGEMVKESLEEVIMEVHKRSLEKRELSVEGASQPNVTLSENNKTKKSRCSYT